MNGGIEPHTTITIANGRICSIGANGRVIVPAGTTIVDGRGRYAIPGLWDLYAPRNTPALQRLVGYGITSVYSTTAADDKILSWYRTMSDPYAAAPTLYATVDGAAGLQADRFRVDPGADLHEALELLVQRGVAPIDALRAATLAPASAAGVADQVGTLTLGAEASLLLLEENPLEDIRNTRSISLMLLRGQTIGLRQLAHLRLAR
jgi:cytosine/adenosine deaminase-related metal-dependent hydrolase